MAPKVHMENINEFMKTIEETGTLFEYEDELFSPIEWLNMIINYMGADYAMNEKIAHYLQFMDRYNGLNKNDPLYPTTVFEKIETRNDVLMGALNFYNLRRNDVENLMENYLSV
tara:strand:+ start:712 stop:1053 length:342 start_codon:yes stop_codon:yes gene_type:complete